MLDPIPLDLTIHWAQVHETSKMPDPIFWGLGMQWAQVRMGLARCKALHLWV
jgi:hypothetical protein